MKVSKRYAIRWRAASIPSPEPLDCPLLVAGWLCGGERNDLKQAQDYYNRAIAIGSETAGKEELMDWQEMLDWIKSKEP